MVPVGVRACDGQYLPVANGSDDRIDVVVHRGAGVDDDYCVTACQIGLRPGVGVRRRIAREQPTDAGRKLFKNGVRGVHGIASATDTPATQRADIGPSRRFELFARRAIQSFKFGFCLAHPGAGRLHACLDGLAVDRCKRIARDCVDVDRLDRL